MVCTDSWLSLVCGVFFLLNEMTHISPLNQEKINQFCNMLFFFGNLDCNSLKYSLEYNEFQPFIPVAFCVLVTYFYVKHPYPLLILFCQLGKVRNKFPLEMAEIHAPVIAADINDDGKIEMVTTDSHGNVAAWTAEGDEIWEVHLKSLIPQASFTCFFCKMLTDCCFVIPGVYNVWQGTTWLVTVCLLL